MLKTHPVDRKTHIKVLIRKGYRLNNWRINLTIPDYIIAIAGLEIGKHYSIAVSGRNILIKRDDFGFMLSKVGNHHKSFGGKICAGANFSAIAHIVGDETNYTQYVPSDSLQEATNKEVLVIPI